MSEQFLKPEGPVGLGGWLVLVPIGLIVAPVRLLMFMLQTYTPIFRDGSWEALTTPGSEAYHPLWAPLLIFEIVGNSALIAAPLALLVVFLRRSRRFPPLFIALAIINLGFILLDAWLGSMVLVEEPMFDSDTVREVGRSLIAVLIWVPYMRLSKRVRNTFVV